MANRFWRGTTSTVHDNINNWSDTDGGATPASSVPGTGDKAEFNANGDNPCSLVDDWTIDELLCASGYTAKLDLVSFDMPFDDGGNVTLDNGGEFDMGTGTMTITNGEFDNKNCATFTRGDSTIVMAGTGTIIGNVSNDLANLTIASGATVTVDASTTSAVDVLNTLTIAGTVNVDTQQLRAVELGSNPQVTITSTGTYSASNGGTLTLVNCTSGNGIVSFDPDGSITGLVRADGCGSGSRLAAGNYAGGIRLTTSNGPTVIEPDNAAYSLASLELESSNANDCTIDNSVNGPASITVAGAFIVDINSSGNVIIDDSGQDVAWILQGGKTDEITGGGVFQWIHDLTQFPRREYLRHGGLMTGGRL